MHISSTVGRSHLQSYSEVYIPAIGLLVTMVILYLQRNEFRNEMLMGYHELGRLIHIQPVIDPAHYGAYPSG